MPLPDRKAPTANPNAAQAPAGAAKGKSRLPPVPQGGLKAPKAYAYVDLPKEQDRCFYLLKLVKAEQFTTEKTRLDKVKHEFVVLDTDAKGVRAGTTVSMLSALQGEQALYFWKEVAPIWICLSGGEVSDESLAELTGEDSEATFADVVDNNGLAGAIARVNLRRTTITDEKSGEKKVRVYKDWEAATEEEIAKYGDK